MIVLFCILIVILLYIHIIVKPNVDITEENTIIIWYTNFKGYRNYIIIK